MVTPSFRFSLWSPLPATHKIKAGEIYSCDFGDLLPPEMTKIRPVVVLSRTKLNVINGTVTVVPLSTAAPVRSVNHAVRLTTDPSPWKGALSQSWAKADMMITLSKQRLGFVVWRSKRFHIQVTPGELLEIRLAASTVLFGGQLSGDAACPCLKAA